MTGDIIAEHYRQLNAYQDDPGYDIDADYEERAAFFATTVGRRWEINEVIYEEALNMLPPLGWRGDSFYLSEFLFDDITHKFSREGGRYFCEVAFYPPRPPSRPKPVVTGRDSPHEG